MSISTGLDAMLTGFKAHEVTRQGFSNLKITRQGFDCFEVARKNLIIS